MSVVLRDYQVEAIESLKAGVATKTSQIVIMATGLGKTVVAADFMKQWDRTGDILFMAHRRELLDQTVKTYERLTGEQAYLEMAECKAPDLPMWGSRRVVVGSVQTLVKRLHLPRFDPDRFSLIIADECHRSITSSQMRILEHFGILVRVDGAEKNFRIADPGDAHCRLVGFTATANRTDNEALEQIFEHVAYRMDILESIHKGWLVKPEQKAVVVTDLDLDSIECRRNESGEMDFAPGQLEELMSEEGPLHEVADTTLQEIGDRQAIIFAAGVAHAKLLEEVLNRRKKDVAFAVYGSLDEEKRRRITADFKSGKLQILVNVFCLVEGFDHPATAVVVMARPTKSLLVYTQMLGRSTRPLPGVVDGLSTAEERKSSIAASDKPSAYILDFVGNSDHKLITTAHVLGGDYTVELRDRFVEKLKAKGGGDVLDVMEEVKAEKAKEIRKEAKAKFAPRSVYEMYPVPIDSSVNTGSGISTRKMDTSATATENQIEALVKMGVKKDMASGYGKKQAGAILSSLRDKRCSNPQAYQLRRLGYDPSEFNFKEASAKISEVLGGRKDAV